MEEAIVEKTITRLIEKVDHKYYGKYRGIVFDNKDPEKLGRLRVKVPSVLGNDVITGWAMPCLPFGGAKDQGFFFIPEDKSGVWIEFEAGDLEFPIWVGTYWAKPGGENEVPKPADTQEPPTQKIIRTVKGHSIEIEDKEGKEKVVILEKVNGNKVTMDKEGIIIEDGANKQKITMNNSGIVIEDKNNNIMEMGLKQINIIPGTVCKFDSGTVPNNNLPACLFTGAAHGINSRVLA